MRARDLNGGHLGGRLTIRRGGDDQPVLITGQVRRVEHREGAVWIRFHHLRPEQSLISRAFNTPPAEYFPLEPDEHVLFEHPGWTEQQIWETRPDSERQQAVTEGAEQ